MDREPSRAALAVVLLITAAISGCRPGPSTEGAPTPAASPVLPTPASASASESGVELPLGFPVLPGAIREQLQPTDEPGTIARWSTDQVGPVVYAFYVDALPAAGYSTTGLYPGGAVAIIAFDSPSGEGWELVLTLEPGSGGTVIEVRRAQS